jgi:hypothetical protein
LDQPESLRVIQQLLVTLVQAKVLRQAPALLIAQCVPVAVKFNQFKNLSWAK